MYKTDTLPHYLPTELIEKIYSDLLPRCGKMTFRGKNKYLHCIITLHHKQITEYPNKYSYVNVGSDYWKELYHNSYKEKVITPLVNLGILEELDYGRNFISFDEEDKTRVKGEPEIRYRINPELFNEKLGTIFYLKEGQKKPDKKRAIPEQKYYPTEYQKKVLRITIDQAASDWIDENARIICEDNLHLNYVDALPIDYIIGFRELIEEGSFNNDHKPIGIAKIKAETKGKQLFHYKDEYYIADLDTFIQLRAEGIKYNYKMEISRLKNMPLISDRNARTLRVYNHLTNFPSKLIPVMRLNGEQLVQIDLSTSQFLLFANLINIYLNEGEERVKSLFKQKETKRYINRFITKIKKYKTVLPSSGISGDEPLSDQQKHHDTLQFIYDVFYRDFYTQVGQLLNIPDRGLAKTILFQQLFRKRSRNDAFNEILREHYPTVMDIMDEFKKQSKKEETESNADDNDEDNNLSVFLQCVEAEIYIDRVLQPLQKNRIPCFSRHDSICIPESYEDQVQEYISNVFDEIGFKYNYKIENHSTKEEKPKNEEAFSFGSNLDNYGQDNPEHEFSEHLLDNMEIDIHQEDSKVYWEVSNLVWFYMMDSYSDLDNFNSKLRDEKAGWVYFIKDRTNSDHRVVISIVYYDQQHYLYYWKNTVKEHHYLNAIDSEDVKDMIRKISGVLLEEIEIYNPDDPPAMLRLDDQFKKLSSNNVPNEDCDVYADLPF